MLLTKDGTVPGLREAKAVQTEIKRLGVKDVELFWDAELKMWGVCQVRKQDSGIIRLDQTKGTPVDKYLMFWCKNAESAYRPPNKQDVQDVIVNVRKAQEWFKKGGADRLEAELNKQDDKKRAAKEQKIKDRFKPHLKALKKSIREELG